MIMAFPMKLVSFFGAFLGAPTLVRSEPCSTDPSSPDIQQLTQKKCKCCVDLDRTIADAEYAYLLFYTSHGSRINSDIRLKYEKLYEEWKHTKIVFGKVDVTIDREFADKWVQPGQVPTNIIFKDGQPVVIRTEDFKKILDVHQGSPEGQKWLINRYLGEANVGRSATSFHHAHPIESTSQLQKKLLLPAPEAQTKKDKKKKKKAGFADPKVFVAYFPGIPETDSKVKSFREAVWWRQHEADEKKSLARVVMTFSASATKATLGHAQMQNNTVVDEVFRQVPAKPGSGSVGAIVYFEKDGGRFEGKDYYLVKSGEKDEISKMKTWMRSKDGVQKDEL